MTSRRTKAGSLATSAITAVMAVPREGEEGLLDLRALLAAGEHVDPAVGERGDRAAERHAVHRLEPEVLAVGGRAGLDAGALGDQRGELVGDQRAGMAVADADHVAARGGLGHQALDRAGEAHAAAVQERDAGGEAADLVDPLRRPQDGGAAAGEAGDQRADALGALGVEVVGGLVDEQDGRRGQQRAGDREALLHAVRPGADGTAGGLGEPDVLEHLAGARERRRGAAGRAGGRRRRGSRRRRCAGRTSGRRPGRGRRARARRGRARRSRARARRPRTGRRGRSARAAAWSCRRRWGRAARAPRRTGRAGRRRPAPCASPKRRTSPSTSIATGMQRS